MVWKLAYRNRAEGLHATDCDYAKLQGMTYARAHLVDAENGGFYHCISRCVRRDWLCGEDVVTGRSYEHRRGWVEARIVMLADIFAVDVFGYAVMSNHYHLVVEVAPKRVFEWSDEEVVRQWLRLSEASDTDTKDNRVASILADRERVSLIRERLGSLSWFMRYLNEPIARKANREDRCTGRFWGGRFRSIALLDESAIVACMAYVDLNPIRTKIAESIESSAYTSVRRRMDTLGEGGAGLGKLSRIGLALPEYVELLQWTVGIARGDVAQPSGLAAQTLGRLNQSANGWLGQVKVHRFKYRAYGAADALKRYAQMLGQRWIKAPTLPGTVSRAVLG